MSIDAPSVGVLLREWRTLRSKSQLALALDADVSTRHLSFIETGRASPSREMILRLADALDVPLRERNALLRAAGFASAFAETDLDAPEMQPIVDALDRLLEQHEPHPAVVMDRHWNVVKANAGAGRLFARFVDLSTLDRPPNVLHLMFDPGSVRPYVENWNEVARWLLVRAVREAVARAPDAELTELLEAIGRYPGVPRPTALGGSDQPVLPVAPVRFRKGSFAVAYFSTVTTLGAPQDVTSEELRIECFHPA